MESCNPPNTSFKCIDTCSALHAVNSSTDAMPPLTPAPTSTRKRKRSEEKLIPGEPFVLQPYVSSLFDAATKISPAVALPRSHVPVSWLSGAPSRLFDSPTSSPPICGVGHVVIAKIEGERQLSAIEKVGDHVYVLYRLSTQLRMKDVRRIGSQKKNLPAMGGARAGTIVGNVSEGKWWCEVGSSSYPFPGGCSPCSPTAATLDMGVHQPASAPCSTHTTRITAITPVSPAEYHLHNSVVREGNEPCVEPCMPDVLDQVRKQYFDALYLTKTSLAYFAKSTLSRARAICHAHEAVPPASRFHHLRTFLHTMILPLPKMDLKYRKLLVQCALEAEIDEPGVFKPGEDSFVHRWRASTFQDRFIKEGDSELKSTLEDLRTRETELQIILLLEILALDNEHPPNDISEPTKGKRKNKTKSKKVKPTEGAPDPDMLLDLLVDRLCIWHSLGSGEGEALNKGREGVSAKDHLRHFSVEVITAFYASKLPEKCASIGNKFGSHGISTPKSTLSASRAARKQNDQHPTNRKAPRLSRSITALPSASVITAESLSLLASADGVAKKPVRGGTLSSKSFTKKIVQMDDKPAAKKIDEELKNVIKTLTKPNRGAVAAELVDDAEKRLARATAKKARKNTKASSASILVTATPKKRRKDTIADGDPFVDSSATYSGPHLSFPPPKVSNTPIARLRADQSVRRHSDEGVPSTPRHDLWDDIEVTSYVSASPRMGMSRRAHTFNSAEDAVFSTPRKEKPDIPGFWSPAGGVALAKETPLNMAKQTALALTRDTPLRITNDTSLKIPQRSIVGPSDDSGSELQTAHEQGDPTSIYDVLGWDNDDDYTL